MPLVSLDIETPTEIFPIPEPQRVPLRLTFPNLTQRYVPARGLLFSAIVHELVLAAMFFITFHLSRTHLPRPVRLTQMIDLGEAGKIVYLPMVGGGEEGNGHEGGAPGVSQRLSSPAPSRSSKGFA